MTTSPQQVSAPAPPPSAWRHTAAFRHHLNIKSAILLALWALFMLWTGWGAVNKGTDALFPAHPTSVLDAYALNTAAPLFALNLWAFLAGLVFALGVLNPFAWLNGKRLVFACMAFAMILGRLITGFMAGPIAYTVNQGHRMLAVVAFQNGRVACIATSDFPGVCRPVGHPPSHQIARALSQGNGQPNTGAAPAGVAFGGCDDAGSRNSMAVAFDDACGLGDVMESIHAEENREEIENRDAVQEGQDMPHPDADVAPED
jgi:hypothetical protein